MQIMQFNMIGIQSNQITFLSINFRTVPFKNIYNHVTSQATQRRERRAGCWWKLSAIKERSQS